MSGREPWFAGLRRWARRRGFPAPWLPLPWRWRLWLVSHRYDIGVGLAEHVCRGNRRGEHTDYWPPSNDQCFCARMRRRLDFIPF